MVYKPNKLQKIIALLLLCCFALTAFAGCGNNNQQADSQPIRIGCKPVPEQLILQETLPSLLEAKTDLTVERLEATAGRHQQHPGGYGKRRDGFISGVYRYRLADGFKK